MRIKTLLFINIAFSIIVLLLICLVIFWAGQKENDAREEEQLADSIVRDVNELRTLAFDYSLQHEERIVVQWTLKLDELKQLIAKADFETSEQKEILDNMNHDMDSIESSFSQLVANRAIQTSREMDRAIYQQQEDRLVSLLLLKAQRIVMYAFKLSEESNVILNIAAQTNRIIVIFSLILTTVTISVSILIIRSIVQPLSKLQEGAQIIGSGNLDYQVDIKSYDEINQLSRAFNQMTGKLKERTSHLESAIRELEDFAYSASHDLRTPLRGIDGFSQVFLEEYGGNLDETGKDYLNRVRAASKKMSDIIDGMLNLLSITRRKMQIREVDLSGLATTIVRKLGINQPQRKVEFVIAQGLTATGDPQMLGIVLENLLDNAWKFTARHPGARIEFGEKLVDWKTAYFVRDDGAGFDMAYADKLFKPFERQHTEAEFRGIGIGLAIVERIIHRHGGKVWAEGEIEKGAIFYFTLNYP